tara:strand:+ start:1700 stop:2146 length:447 start_codon:yes stop_codon:yes gene_type:complete
MIFNKKFLHALEAILDISLYSTNSPTRAKEITKRQRIPSRYLEKILQELVHQNILKGTRGPNGGYTLGKEKRNIFLIDVYNAILLIEKRTKKKEIDTEVRTKIIDPFMKNITNEITSSFKLTTIYDLYKRINESKINIKKDKKIDFTI